MSILARLARLKPLMPRERLFEIIGHQSDATQFFIGSGFAAEIDEAGFIRSLRFHSSFPSRIDIDGLHIGMTEATLTASKHKFSLAIDGSGSYISSRQSGEEIKATMSDGRLFKLEILSQGNDGSAKSNLRSESVHVSPFEYDDDDEMVRDWAARFTFHEDHEGFLRYAEWLLKQTDPDVLHGIAAETNWGYGIEPLLWVIRQKTCEKATALSVFYLARPGDMLEYFKNPQSVPTCNLHIFKLAQEVRARYLSGFYKRATIAFDGPLALKTESYLPDNIPDNEVEAVIPKMMQVVIKGRDSSSLKYQIPWSPGVVWVPEEEVKKMSLTDILFGLGRFRRGWPTFH